MCMLRDRQLYDGDSIDGAPEISGSLGGQPGQQIHQGPVHLIELAAEHDVAQLCARASAAHLPHIWTWPCIH